MTYTTRTETVHTHTHTHDVRVEKRGAGAGYYEARLGYYGGRLGYYGGRLLPGLPLVDYCTRENRGGGGFRVVLFGIGSWIRYRHHTPLTHTHANGHLDLDPELPPFHTRVCV